MASKWVGSRIFLGAVCSVLGACGMPSAESPTEPLVQPQKPIAVSVRPLHNKQGAPSLSSVATATKVVSDSPEQVAWATLRGIKDGHKLSGEAVESAKLREVHDAGNGPLIARFEQEVDGLPVFLQSMNIAMDRNMQPTMASGRLATKLRKVAERFQLDESVAVESALRAMSGERGSAVSMGAAQAAPGGYQNRQFVAQLSGSGAQASVSSRSRKIYFPTDKGLVPSYYVELDVAPLDSTSSTMRAFVVSSIDGKVLFEKSLTEDVAYSYRVYSDGAPGYVPWDGAQGNDYTPYPKAAPDGSAPALGVSSLVTLENVPFRRNDPWLPPGATELSGNNGWAYVDQIAPDGYSAGDLLVPPTSAGSFDRTFDLSTTAPSANDTAKRTVATNFFYIVNYLHDVTYDAGWTEAAANPQKSNFGRGGVEGDMIRLEAQDNSGRNNANASTPADGGMPRIQMYLWDASSTSLTVTAPAGVAGTYQSGGASFGAKSYNITNSVIPATDAPGPAGSTTDGCDAITNPAAIAGKIALVDRGNCNFSVKAVNVQNAGAVGLLIANTMAGATAFGPGGTDPTVTIGVQGISYADGVKLRTAAMSGTVTAKMTASYNERDSSLDGSIVSHEWGHILSNRLIGNGSGLSASPGRSMGEGWSDFNAMLMIVRPEDETAPANANWSGTYSTGAPSVFSAGNNAFFEGIRRYPYSTELTKNPLTFKHMTAGVKLPTSPAPTFGADGSTNGEVHSSGEVWANMLWECYAALLRDKSRLTFQQAQERMRRYHVAALKLTPNNPTFTEARDAMLFAAYSSDRQDYDLFVAAFAKRGMGDGAVASDPFETDPDPANGKYATHAGIQESFSTGAALNIDPASVTVDQSLMACDTDGVLDNGESGYLSFRIYNTGSKDVQNGTVTITTPTGSSVTVNGQPTATLSLPPIPPFSSNLVQVKVAMAGAQSIVPVQFDIEAKADNLVGPSPITASYMDIGNYDMKAASSTVEKFAGRPTLWKVSNDANLDTSEAWTPVINANAGYMHGPDTGAPSDHYLVSPTIDVGTGNFTLSLKHRYSFETDTTVTPPDYYDGAVVEYSLDGKTWTDAKDVPGVIVMGGYTGTLATYTGNLNPLTNRSAFAGATAGYATGAWVTSSFNFGTALAGKKLTLRFRIGSDNASGDEGWDIDEVAVTGANAPPFQSQVLQSAAAVCKAKPVFSITQADLKSIPTGFQVRLDPTIANAPGAISWTWTQLDGTPVQLGNSDTPNVTFTAPDSGTVIHLKWAAVSAGVTLEGTVAIEVVKAGDSSSGTAATGCQMGGQAAPSLWSGLVASALLLLGRRRRKS